MLRMGRRKPLQPWEIKTMKQTNQSLAEAIQGMAQHVIDTQREIFAVIDCPLHIQVSSDHSEIHMTKGALHLMIALNGDDAGIYDCNSMGYCIQNPYWVGSLKVADVLADIWAVSYNIDRFMSQQTVAS